MQSLRGHLLIAGPNLWDPNFRRTVVLIGDHDEDGAIGVVLNRPSTVAVVEAMPPLADLVAADELLFVGGPVLPETVVVVADFAEPERAGAIVTGSIGFLPDGSGPHTLGAIRKARVFAGHAGWGAGQLEEEIEQGSWIVESALPTDIFTGDADGLWSAVLRRKGKDFAVLALMPVDPSLN